MAELDLVIRAKGLGKCYHVYDKPRDRLLHMLWRRRFAGHREFWALRDVDCTIRRGETVGIIGRNGAGKSTLLQLICQTLTPTTGEVQVTGKVAALLELGSGFNPEFSGRENVYLNGALHGLSPQQIDARFERIAEFAEIGDFIDRPVKTYSSGMFVRLAFAVIAHVDADVLIVDEALAVGDAAFSRKCARFLREFMATGTVLFVSHDTASVKNLCDRVIWLDHGKVMADGDPKTVSDTYLQYLYESQQGKGQSSASPSRPRSSSRADKPRVPHDMRRDFLNATNLRNDIQVFDMDGSAKAFGNGGASLHSAELQDAEGRPLSWLVGGETVQLVIKGEARETIRQAVVGFSVKDRLGQYLFADNTYLGYLGTPVAIAPGERFTARFRFVMPILRAGDYSIDIAIADGTQSEHVQQLWVHDAIPLKSVTSSVCNGLVGIPMEDISLDVT